MGDNDNHKCHFHGSRGGEIAGPLWFWGWLFTIGFLKLAVTKAIYALILWPYYLGVHFRPPQ
jgi:hypothetical protein